MRPYSAGVRPSQCCSNVASNTVISPSGEKASSVTSNWPVSVLQPRPSPVISRPGEPAAWKAARLAPVYEPTTSGRPSGADIATSHPVLARYTAPPNRLPRSPHRKQKGLSKGPGRITDVRSASPAAGAELPRLREASESGRRKRDGDDESA